MNEPSVAVALLQSCCRDEALVGDILEEYEQRRSRAWLWRQVAVAVVFGLPYGTVRRERASARMPMPLGGIGLVAVVALITIVAPGAWWLLGIGAAGGLGLAIALVMITSRRKLRDRGRRSNVLLPLVLTVCAAGVAAGAEQQPVPAVPTGAVDGILEAFKTDEVVMLPGGHGSKLAHALLLRILRDPEYLSMRLPNRRRRATGRRSRRREESMRRAVALH